MPQWAPGTVSTLRRGRHAQSLRDTLEIAGEVGQWHRFEKAARLSGTTGGLSKAVLKSSVVCRASSRPMFLHLVVSARFYLTPGYGRILHNIRYQTFLAIFLKSFLRTGVTTTTALFDPRLSFVSKNDRFVRQS